MDFNAAEEVLGKIARIDHDNPEGFAFQIIKVLLNAINGRALSPGTGLPSIPAMARYQGTSPKPVQNAYRYLVDKKVLISRSGQGTRVNPTLDRSILSHSTAKEALKPPLGHFGTRMSFIGMLVPTVESSLHATIVRMLETKFHENGQHMILGNYEDHMAKLSGYLSSWKGRDEIARIIISPFSVDFAPRCQNLLKSMEDRIILLANKLPDINVPCVMLDHRKGGYLGAEYLFKMGHRNILFIAGPENNASSDGRKCGFLDFFKNKKANISRIGIEHGTFMKKDAYQIACRLFKKRKDYTAIFCVNSLSCIGVLLALRDLNISIPDDVSVITFDDMDYPSYVPMTAIAQPLEKMAEDIISIIDGEKRGDMEILAEPRLIARSSVAMV